MLFGKRDKKNKQNERVLDLKARVDALRRADETSRGKDAPPPQSLDHFLSGDDVLTGREVEDNYIPTGFVPTSLEDDVDLEAELQKYLKRQEAPDGDQPAPRGNQLQPEDRGGSAATANLEDSSPQSSFGSSWPAEDEWPPRQEKAG